MREDFLLHSDTARSLYEGVRELPIYDYHCHLSPKEIWEDKPFTDIADMMLDSDHYKWRLMRSANVREELITGHRTGTGVTKEERFRAYAGALEGAAGNPLYQWTHMELSEFFGIGDALNAGSADNIRERANAFLSSSGSCRYKKASGHPHGRRKERVLPLQVAFALWLSSHSNQAHPCPYRCLHGNPIHVGYPHPGVRPWQTHHRRTREKSLP